MLVDQFGNAIKSPATRGATRGVLVRGRYDAAATTDDNRRHWASADSLSAVSANSSAIRRTLRNRSRYEVANNCYARGILNTVAAYTVGIGPTLQLTYRGEQQTDPQQLITCELPPSESSNCGPIGLTLARSRRSSRQPR
jgi:hypothetical protein